MAITPGRAEPASVPVLIEGNGVNCKLGGTKLIYASPHFSPGGMIMAQEFSLQRVLVTEERSGFYGRGSMCALKGKGQARACPAPSVIRKPLPLSQSRH